MSAEIVRSGRKVAVDTWNEDPRNPNTSGYKELPSPPDPVFPKDKQTVEPIKSHWILGALTAKYVCQCGYTCDFPIGCYFPDPVATCCPNALKFPFKRHCCVEK